MLVEFNLNRNEKFQSLMKDTGNIREKLNKSTKSIIYN